MLSYAFHASTKRNIEEKSMLLSIIGLYYSYFHLIAALMCIDPHLKYEQLPRFPLDHYRARRDGIEDFMKNRGINPRQIRYLSHQKVEKYVSSVSRKGILSEDFISAFREAKSLRLSVNYAPAYFGYLGLDELIASLIQKTQDNFDEANRLIFTLNREYIETSEKHGMFWAPQDFLESFIGDAIGDDFAGNYLNEQESREVFLTLEKALPYAKCEVCGKETQNTLIGRKPVIAHICSTKCMREFQANLKRMKAKGL